MMATPNCHYSQQLRVVAGRLTVAGEEEGCCLDSEPTTPSSTAMELSADERQWALNLKRAAAAHPDILTQNMTDYEFAQHAIVARDDLDGGLARIRGLQSFKDRYGILLDGSFEQGMRDVFAFKNFLPSFYLGSAAYSSGGSSTSSSSHHNDEKEEDGASSQVICFDFSRYQTQKLDSEEAYAVCMRAYFYALQVTSSNFASIRNGLHILGDYQRLTWRQFAIVNEQRASELYSNCYPIKVVEIAVMQANPLIRLFFCLLKLVVSTKKTMQAYQHTFPRNRDAFLKEGGFGIDAIPQKWGGNLTPERVGANFRVRLMERYKNSEEFELEESID